MYGTRFIYVCIIQELVSHESQVAQNPARNIISEQLNFTAPHILVQYLGEPDRQLDRQLRRHAAGAGAQSGFAIRFDR